jgi:queuine tRNA-ribosyltransferase
MTFRYECLHQDKHCQARLGRLHTPRGVVDLPTFMPVGTRGSVKGLTIEMVRQTGAQIILGNTYHLSLRPGEEIVAALGGLHEFTGWTGPILTDSGGFQVFSLEKLNKIDEQGVVFRSVIDGRLVHLTPERSMEIQQQLGSDIAMVLDHVPALPSSPAVIADACQRSIRWADRCLKVPPKNGQVLFGIVQGGLDVELRKMCAQELVAMDFPGYAIGGLSVGEAPADMYRTIAATTPHLPLEKPRYLMGVGTPTDLLEAIRLGIDMFDCVMPTRNGRNAMVFTHQGPLRLKNQKHSRDRSPLDERLVTPYSHYSRGYLRHLFLAGEMLGPILASFHNLAYYADLMRLAREAIAADCFLDFVAQQKANWSPAETSQVG